MNVFKTCKAYRKLGPNYGLPMWVVECGAGVKYDSIELVRKMGRDGLSKEDWVVVLNGIKERGIGTFTDALKYVGVKVEFECLDTDKEPQWFNNVDRWVVRWTGGSGFNLQGLRSRQDLLLFEGPTNKLLEFIEKTSKSLCLRGAVFSEPEKVWELVKSTNVRVYGKQD